MVLIRRGVPLLFCLFHADQRKSREKALKKELLALRRQIQKERRSRGSGETGKNSDCDVVNQAIGGLLP